MDFMNRGDQGQTAPVSNGAGTPVSRGSSVARKKDADDSKLKRIAAVGMLFLLTILIVAAIGTLFFGPTDQSKFVQSSKYQAVFLTNGQVYFGKMTGVGSDSFKLQDIYYLTQNTTTNAQGQAASDGNYTLVKLGCQQIHDPIDQMVIMRNQVSFWENLNDKGKVVTSINEFKKQNPNGPDCTQVSNQTQASGNSTSSNQGGNSAATGTNSAGTSAPTSNTTIKKP